MHLRRRRRSVREVDLSVMLNTLQVSAIGGVRTALGLGYMGLGELRIMIAEKFPRYAVKHGSVIIGLSRLKIVVVVGGGGGGRWWR